MILNYMVQKRIFPYVILFIIITSSIIFSSAYGYSQKIETLILNASHALSQNDLDSALSNYDQILKIDPKNTVALGNKGVVLANMQRYNESIPFFDQILKIDPNNVDALNNKAAALIKLGKYDDAALNFDKVLQIDPKNKVALSNKKIISFNNTKLSGQNDTDYYAYCQVEIRNKDNQLVTYLEPELLSITDPSFFNTVMNTLGTGKSGDNISQTVVEKSFVYKEDKKFELTKIILTSTEGKTESLAAQTGYAVNGKWVLTAVHDGYQIEPGDIFKSTWNIIRPVH